MWKKPKPRIFFIIIGLPLIITGIISTVIWLIFFGWANFCLWYIEKYCFHFYDKKEIINNGTC